MCMGSGLCCGWLQCTMYLLYAEHGRYGLSCLYAETVESMSSASWVCMVCMVHMYYDLSDSGLCCGWLQCTMYLLY